MGLTKAIKQFFILALMIIIVLVIVISLSSCSQLKPKGYNKDFIDGYNFGCASAAVDIMDIDFETFKKTYDYHGPRYKRCDYEKIKNGLVK